MQRNYLLGLLDDYQCQDNDEQQMLTRMIDFVQQHGNCFSRDLLVGHITGSAWIVSPDFSKALLLHHKKLNRWLQPGGHSDGDPNTLAVALREAREETGIEDFNVGQDGIFDVDIHTIPAKGEEPQHEHFDVRFLLVAPAESGQHNEESHQLQWLALEQIQQMNSDASISRMIKKTQALQGK